MKQRVKNIQIISEAKADKNHHLSDFIEYAPSGDIFLLDGDLHLKNHLELDFDDDFWMNNGQKIKGLIVTGDLIVDGSIINAEGDYGPFLLVKGNLKAEHGIFGGSSVVITKNATFSGLVVGHYNHGTLNISGETQAKLIINDDHSININSASPHWNDYDDNDGLSNFSYPLSDYLHEDIEIATSEDDEDIEAFNGVSKKNGEYLETLEKLINRIYSNQPILKKKQPEKTRAAWINAIAEKPRSLVFVPKQFVDDAFYLEIIKENNYALEYIPEDKLTTKLIESALKENGDTIKYVPESMLNLELYQLAMSSEYSDYVFEYTPESFKRAHPEIIAEAINMDGDNIKYVPSELLSEALIITAIRECDGYPSTLMHYLPETKITNTVATQIAISSPYSIKSLPKNLMTSELLLAAYKANGDLPSDLLSTVSDEIKKEFSALISKSQKQQAFEQNGLSFKHTSNLTLTEHTQKKNKNAWIFESDHLIMLIAKQPIEEAISLEKFLKQNLKSQKWINFGKQVAELIATRQWPKAEKMEQTDVEQHFGFSGMEYQAEQILHKTHTITKSIRYLTKDFEQHRVIVMLQFNTDKSLLIEPEIESILSSLAAS